VVKAASRRAIVDYLKNCHVASERRACCLAGIARRVYSYKSCKDPQTVLRLRMKELAMARMRYGYRKIGTLLKREGFPHSMGMLYRVYREEGLSTALSARTSFQSPGNATTTQTGIAARSSVESGLCSGSTLQWKSVPLPDHCGCLYPGMSGN
jgi:putative transposase